MTPALTPREAEVLALTAEGLTAYTVGRRLGTSPRTVEKHLEHIYAKYGVTNAHAAVRRLHDTEERLADVG